VLTNRCFIPFFLGIVVLKQLELEKQSITNRIYGPFISFLPEFTGKMVHSCGALWVAFRTGRHMA